MFNKNLVLIFLFAFSFLKLSAQAPAVVPGSDAALAKRFATFEKVWSTVNEKHYDKTFGGVDWTKVRRDYEPQALAAKTDDELHAILRKMLGELKLSHFGIFPKGLSAEESKREAGSVGIDIIYLDGQPLINRVEANSPANIAGLRAGFLLTKIDGNDVAEMVRQFDANLAARKLTLALMQTYRERFLESKINGKPGTDVEVEFDDGTNKSAKYKLKREEFSGQMSQPIGHFPPQQVVFESRLIGSDVGYVRFNMWVIPQMAKLRAAVREFTDTKAIIIDLRGNPGGVGGMAPGLAGLMLDEQRSLGTMHSREGSTSFIAYPQTKPFKGKVFLLTDHGSGSTSEVFAAGMQEIGRGTIVGNTTAGAVLPSIFELLPTGALFQYAVSDYRSPSNTLIEGRGVFPNVEISQTRAALLAGRDIQLEKALELINKK